jgi:hypothetical protein
MEKIGNTRGIPRDFQTVTATDAMNIFLSDVSVSFFLELVFWCSNANDSKKGKPNVYKKIQYFEAM